MEIFSARSRAITRLALAGALTLGSLGLPRPARAEQDSQPFCTPSSGNSIFYDEGLCRGGCTTEVEVTVYVDTEGSFDADASFEENPDSKPTGNDSAD